MFSQRVSVSRSGASVQEDCIQDLFSCGELKCNRDALQVEGAEGARAPRRGEFVRAEARAVLAREHVDKPLLSHPSLHSVLTSHAMTKRVTMSDQFVGQYVFRVGVYTSVVFVCARGDWVQFVSDQGARYAG